MPVQEVDTAAKYVRRYGSKVNVMATEANGTAYERLTLHKIRRHSQPGDRILCAVGLPGYT